MPGEDEIEIPDTWRYAVHPRRHGMAGLEQGRGPGGDMFRDAAVLAANAALAAYGFEDPGIAADEAGSALVKVDELVAERGLAGAAVAFAESYAHEAQAAGILVPSFRWDRETWDDDGTWIRGFPGAAAKHLRSMLAIAPQDVYDDAVAALTPLRDGLFRQRIVASYLVPDRHDWVSADLAQLPAHQVLGGLLFYSVATVEQLSRFRASTLDDFVTAYDAVGNELVPLLARWLTVAWWAPQARRDALEVLTRIPADAAFDVLLHLTGLPEVPGGVREAADRFPERAARMLAAHRDIDLVSVLFVRHAGAHPDVPEARLVARVPDAPADAVPELLASPPWTRQPPARVAVAPSRLATEPRIIWRDGEQEQWAYDWRSFRAEETRKYLPLAETGDAPAEFYISGPADLVRPHLPAWKAESTWFYLEDPEVVVGKYELDALPPVLRLARRKPVVGAALLMPYLAQEVAKLMAEWLTRSRSFRPVAQEWFERHGGGAAALLIPVALGGPWAQSRTAALALARIDTADVLTAAGELGCRDAVEAFLGRDPLDLVPAKIPAVPKWADPVFLPQVLLPGGGYAVPPEATAALLRMMAMSQLDAPYEGLRVIAGQCDPASLSEFAWSLYRLWEIEGRPSKDAWAMNALGYFGDDTVAGRLAPLVRAWPSEGAAPRAKRGADVLAAMGTDGALGHLSALARNAKSAPLRAHAAAALDRAAAGRGLLPEQLDDLLAPDLGLDADPVGYRDVSYAVELSAKGELVLRDPSASQLTALPKAAGDDERAVTSAWNSRRRKARPVIADQMARLEEAMVIQRRWAADEFRSRIAGHPLLGRLARELVWVLDDRTVALDALGDLADPAGGLAGPGEWVRLAHPAIDDFTPWTGWLARRTAPPPFAQADREVFPGQDPSAYWQRTVDAAALYNLLRRGWHWGSAGRQALRDQLFRPFGAQGRVVLTIDPGVSAVQDPKHEPQQMITEITFESSEGELGVFGDLSPVTRSELIRSLRTLE
jgi:hypothetical protein